MRHALKAIRDYAGLAALVLVAGGLTVAATGDALKLGQSNSANKPTGVQNSGTGAVLDLKAKDGQPPLKVNSDAKVRNLNADKLDGRDVSALALTAAVYTKAQADARFAAAGAAYTKAQADARFAATGAAYTKAQADARYGRVLYSKTFSGTTPNGGVFGLVLDSFDLSIPGPGIAVALLRLHPGSLAPQAALYGGNPAAVLFTVGPSASGDGKLHVVAALSEPSTHFEVRLTDPSLGSSPYTFDVVILFYPTTP